MLNDDFVEAAILIRKGATKATWEKICCLLQTADKGDSLEQIMAKMPVPMQNDLYFVSKSFLQIGSMFADWNSIGHCLEMAGIVYQKATKSEQSEIVWSGPESEIISVRRTDQVLYDLFSAAKKNVLLVTFAAAKIEHLSDILFQAANRGVKVKLVLEFEEQSEGQLSVDALNAFAGNIRDIVHIYYWPTDKRERNAAGKPGKLHVKVAVVDESAFITSANLTDDAFNRNMELGVLFREGPIPILVRNHFDSLIHKKILTRYLFK
jgi:cardiolipin synthase A/B